jgi:hypothetical protein
MPTAQDRMPALYLSHGDGFWHGMARRSVQFG